MNYPKPLSILLVLACLTLGIELSYVWRDYRFGAIGTNDFIEYWSAGQLLLQRENPYDPDPLYEVERTAGWPEKDPLIMWNPPWLLTLLLPLLFLPFKQAGFLWLLINIVVILICGAVIWQLLAPEGASKQLIVPWIATLAFMPALFTLRMGQMSSLILLGIVGFLFFVTREKDIPAGAFLALTTIKPHIVYLLFVVVSWWVATRKRWGVLIGFVGALAALMIPLSWFRPGWAGDYLLAMRHSPLYWRTPVLGGVLRAHLFSPEHTWIQFMGPALLAPLTLAFLVLRGQRFDWLRAVGPILLLSVPTAAYGWSFDQIVLLIPYIQVIVWLVEDGRGKIGRSTLIFIALLLMSGLMFWQNRRGFDELCYFWMPIALGLIYIYGKVALCHRGSWLADERIVS